MEEALLAALREAALKAGAVDGDVIALDSFADVVGKVRKEQDRFIGVDEAIEAMKSTKPHLFTARRDWSSMTDSAFDTARDELHQKRHKKQPVTQPIDTKKIDATRLSPEEFAIFRRAVSYQSSGRVISSEIAGRLRSVLARQLSEDQTIGAA